MSEKKAGVCSYAGCGRPARAMGLCQTHYKQQLRGEALKPIARKRAGREGTERYAGLSLTAGCVAAIEDRAKREKKTPNAVITDILEEWTLQQRGEE